MLSETLFMSREWQSYLADIKTACEKVRRFTAGMDRKTFFEDDRTYHAVIHCLLIVGEAVKRLPDDVRREMPAVEWRKIAGMRDWLAHVYFSINSDILWDVVESKVPSLLQEIEFFLAKRAHDAESSTQDGSDGTHL
jgi:uncharacterized protein with HEPN domain